MRPLWLATAVGVLAVGAALIAGPQDAARLPALPPTSELFTHSPFSTCAANETPLVDRRRRLRVATWNIQAARSSSVQAIADELRAMQADVIALQEVDVGARRTGFIDEPAALADALDFDYAFAASIKWDQGDYGLAVLSRWPLSDARRYRMDSTAASEPRIALDVVVCVGGRPLRVFDHHADNRAASRTAGLTELRNLVAPEVGRGILVAGDFNERPEGPDVKSLMDAGLFDLLTFGNEGPAAPGPRIDYLMADGPLARRVSTASVWRTEKSDHNAVFADLAW